MTTDPSTHLFWITSRAAGTTAMVLASVSLCAGLAISGKLRKGPGADRRVLHEVLSLGVMVAVAVHGLALLGDGYLKASVADIAVPFAFSYETGWTTLGIVAGYGMTILGLAYYVRGRIGQDRFRLIHRFNLLFWVAGLVHSLGEGSDASQAWYVGLLALTAAPAPVFLALRIREALRRRPSRPAATAA